MIVIYRTRPSNSARELVETLPNCRRALNLNRRPARSGDHLVCWGESLDPINGVEILNGTPILNKFTDATKLKAEGVPTVEVSRTRPQDGQSTQIPRGNYDLSLVRGLNHLTEDQARDLRDRVNVWLSTPLATRPAQTWLPRQFNHIGGRDLLNPPRNPDYYSRREYLVEEYRIHCFKGRSIRAGRKTQGVEGVTGSHEWIRSLQAGWRISYDGFESTKKMRKLAKDALDALNLDFGAVDIGKTSDNKLIVLEVNRAPGLSDGTVAAYAKWIRAWAEGEILQETAAA